MKGDWLRKDDKIKGFEWRGGTERVTSGIHIWSKPYVKIKMEKRLVRNVLYNLRSRGN